MIGLLSIRISTSLMRATQKSHLLMRSVEKNAMVRSIRSETKFFHTSPKRAIHPLIVVILKPVGKLIAIISGRMMRKKLRAATPGDKARWKNSLWTARWKIAGTVGLISVVSGINFITHIQETPMTHRKRFLAFTDEQFQKLGEYSAQLQMEAYKDQIVPTDDPAYKVIMDVAQKIVNSNQEHEFFRKQTWTVIVVDSELENAFVTPAGHIFVFTGLLRTVGHESRLAAVIGHEMSHAFLSHIAEQVSYAAVIDWFIILVMAALWVIVPNDGIAVITQWFYNKVVDIFLHLPYSRKLEEEADYVGLQLMAKACYDVRDSSAFWELMDLREKHVTAEDKQPPPELLSTHPASANRARKLDEWMAQALALRASCNCPRVPSTDPRQEIRDLRASLDAEKKRHDEQKASDDEKRKTEARNPKPKGVGVIAAASKS